METKVFYVVIAFDTTFQPTIVEKFDNLTDAESYAALVCRTKKTLCVVLERQTEWDGASQKNA